MQKIPTMFVRDPIVRARVLDEVLPRCQWVADGEGIATQKLDGSCCMVRSGELFKRRELRGGEPHPLGFIAVDHDPVTQRTVGWVPVGDGNDDVWHRAAFDYSKSYADGTYELIGPKVNGNHEKRPGHVLERHGAVVLADVPRTFDGLHTWLAAHDVEGIVFHHPDGRLAKIKCRDFGLRR